MMADDIEPVANLPIKRRKTALNFRLCIFCQSSRPALSIVVLHGGSLQGIQRIKEVCNLRVQYHHVDSSYGDIVKLLQPCLDELESHAPKWHKTCYASFTSKANLNTLVNRSQDAADPDRMSTAEHDEQPLTRQSISFVDWKRCVFCQKRTRECVHQVQSKDVNLFIHACAKSNYALKCRIGENNLIAYEAHYHTSCKVKEGRKSSTVTSDGMSGCAPNNDAFDQLVGILRRGFQGGSVYNMDDVCTKYNQLLGESGEESNCRSHHLKRKLNAAVAKPMLASPVECGWYTNKDNQLSPVLLTVEPVPAVCVELLTCGCKARRCSSNRCTCYKHNMRCSLGCKCVQDCSNPYQAQQDEDSDDNDDD